MQNKDEKWFTRKKGAMLLLSLSLVGAAAVTTYYAMDLSEDRAKEEYTVDLNEEASAETEATAVLADEAQADFSDEITEMDVDPATLAADEAAREAAEELAAETTGTGSTEDLAAADTDEKTADENTAEDLADAGTENTADEAAEASAQIQATVSFAATEQLQWPVAGTVLMDYSMDSTVYFATLDQYKYNPALILGAEEGTQVVAAAKGIVDEIAVNEETGTTIRMNLGDGYTLIYGQLKEVTVSEGDVVNMGQLIGYVSQPTKYYCEEGSNLYFALEKDGEAADPFLYLE